MAQDGNTTKLPEAIVRWKPGIEFIKRYALSGQKDVFLVKVDSVLMIMKIVNGDADRIQRELDVERACSIPRIPYLIDSSYLDIAGQDKLCYLEEYVEGERLDEIVEETGDFDLDECSRLLNDLLEITESLELESIVHRDIKLRNIIRDGDGRYHLIDFGNIRCLKEVSLTLAPMARGPHTPGYAAPELFRYDKGAIDSRSDLFSIGTVAYEVLFGGNPFVEGKFQYPEDVYLRTMTITPPSHIIKGDKGEHLMAFILSLMEKKIDERPQSAHIAREQFLEIKGALLHKPA